LQTVTDVKVDASAPATTGHDSRGNTVAHFVLDRPELFGKELEVKASYSITRLKAVTPSLGVALAASESARFEEDLKENRLVPLTPRVKALAQQLAAGRTDPVAKAKAFYDYLVDNGTYDKTTP